MDVVYSRTADIFVGSMKAPSKVFLLFFLLPDRLNLNHLKTRMEGGFSHIFSRHFSSTVAETIGLKNTQQLLTRENVQKTIFEAAEMILGPWNQQYDLGISYPMTFIFRNDSGMYPSVI